MSSKIYRIIYIFISIWERAKEVLFSDWVDVTVAEQRQKKKTAIF